MEQRNWISAKLEQGGYQVYTDHPIYLIMRNIIGNVNIRSKCWNQCARKISLDTNADVLSM